MTFLIGDCYILVYGHQIFTKTFEFLRRVPLGVEICVLVAHRYSEARMSEQLLDCHYIHAPGHQAGRKRVSQRMPRHTYSLDPEKCSSQFYTS